MLTANHNLLDETGEVLTGTFVLSRNVKKVGESFEAIDEIRVARDQHDTAADWATLVLDDPQVKSF